MNMRRILLLLTMAMALAVCAGVQMRIDAAEKKVQPVPYDAFGASIDIIGPLGQPLGKVVEIEGRLVPQEEKHTKWEDNYTKNLFEVTKVNGRPIAPTRLDVTSFSFQPVAIPERATVKLLGYQNGRFEDIPKEALQYLPTVQHREWHFRVDFVALKRTDSPSK